MFYSNMEGPAMLGSSTARSENTWGLEMLFAPGAKSLGMVHVFSEARDHVAEHGLQCRLVAFRRTTVLLYDGDGSHLIKGQNKHLSCMSVCMYV